MKAGRSKNNKAPDYKTEKELLSQGFKLIAGIDEVGRGALAGPVVAAAVIIPNAERSLKKAGIRDSKQLNSIERETAFDIIIKKAADIGIGIVSAQIIDEINILGATKRAMYRAIRNLSLKPDYLLIDGLVLPHSSVSQQGVIKGDSRCLSIACASIIAKVIRDRVMIDIDKDFPDYGFALHKGYGTKRHLLVLNSKGPLSIHRYSFAPVRNMCKLV